MRPVFTSAYTVNVEPFASPHVCHVARIVYTQSAVDYVVNPVMIAHARMMINHVRIDLRADTTVLASKVNVALQSVTSVIRSKNESIKFLAAMKWTKVLIIAISSLLVSTYFQFKL